MGEECAQRLDRWSIQLKSKVQRSKERLLPKVKRLRLSLVMHAWHDVIEEKNLARFPLYAASILAEQKAFRSLTFQLETLLVWRRNLMRRLERIVKDEHVRMMNASVVIAQGETEQGSINWMRISYEIYAYCASITTPLHF